MASTPPAHDNIVVEIKDCPTAAETIWCKSVHASTTLPADNRPSASAVAFLIMRGEMEYQDIDRAEILGICETMHELFDDEIVYDDVVQDYFLLFHEVFVEPGQRRKGLGRAIVEAMCKEVQESLGSVVPIPFLAAPGFLGKEMEREIAKEGAMFDDEKCMDIQRRQYHSAKAFWENLGFKKFKARNRPSVFHVRI